jgi:hypothetical protein
MHLWVEMTGEAAAAEEADVISVDQGKYPAIMAAIPK